jgi:hypothetical protein
MIATTLSLFDWLVDQPWLEDAACRGAPLDLFFAKSADHQYLEARAFCRTCPVLRECREATDRAERDLPRGALFGFFGGESAAERHTRRRARQTAAVT